MTCSVLPGRRSSLRYHWRISASLQLRAPVLVACRRRMNTLAVGSLIMQSSQRIVVAAELLVGRVLRHQPLSVNARPCSTAAITAAV
jgi:hypothetical protein